jgi:hypothetical protein
LFFFVPVRIVSGYIVTLPPAAMTCLYRDRVEPCQFVRFVAGGALPYFADALITLQRLLLATPP